MAQIYQLGSVKTGSNAAEPKLRYVVRPRHVTMKGPKMLWCYGTVRPCMPWPHACSFDKKRRARACLLCVTAPCRCMFVLFIMASCCIHGIALRRVLCYFFWLYRMYVCMYAIACQVWVDTVANGFKKVLHTGCIYRHESRIPRVSCSPHWPPASLGP